MFSPSQDPQSLSSSRFVGHLCAIYAAIECLFNFLGAQDESGQGVQGSTDLPATSPWPFNMSIVSYGQRAQSKALWDFLGLSVLLQLNVCAIFPVAKVKLCATHHETRIPRDRALSSSSPRAVGVSQFPLPQEDPVRVPQLQHCTWVRLGWVGLGWVIPLPQEDPVRVPQL